MCNSIKNIWFSCCKYNPQRDENTSPKVTTIVEFNYVALLFRHFISFKFYGACLGTRGNEQESQQSNPLIYCNPLHNSYYDNLSRMIVGDFRIVHAFLRFFQSTLNSTLLITFPPCNISFHREAFPPLHSILDQ